MSSSIIFPSIVHNLNSISFFFQTQPILSKYLEAQRRSRRSLDEDGRLICPFWTFRIAQFSPQKPMNKPFFSLLLYEFLVILHENRLYLGHFLMNFQDLPKKKNISRKNLRALLKKRSLFAEGIPLSPYFSENNKDLKHVFRT
jgi:hypothetical protein